MRTSRALIAICALAVVTACSGGDDGDENPVSASPDPCALPTQDGDVTLPEGCEPTPGPTAPTGPPPSEGSAFYDAVKIDRLQGELRATGNDVDVTKTSDTFSVTVQPGNRIGVAAVCEGRTKVTIVTVPDSGAATDFTCGFQGTPSQFSVAESKAVTTATTYQVTITVPAPARWYATFYESKPGADPLLDPSAQPS